MRAASTLTRSYIRPVEEVGSHSLLLRHLQANREVEGLVLVAGANLALKGVNQGLGHRQANPVAPLLRIVGGVIAVETVEELGVINFFALRIGVADL